MQSSKYYDTVFQLKKGFNKSSLVLYLSFILVTWSLLQISLTDFFEINDNILMKIPSIYAQDDGGVNGNGGEDGNGEVSNDNWDSDIEEQSLDKGDTQDEGVGQEYNPERLPFSEDGQDEYVDVFRFVNVDPSGTDITLQLLPSGDPQPLPVALPPLPGGPFPPGGLPPFPGSPLPPGSPIPPGGGPTPPEDLLPPPPLAKDLPSDDGHHDDDDDDDDDDDENKEDDEEKEDEDNNDKDNN